MFHCRKTNNNSMNFHYLKVLHCLHGQSDHLSTGTAFCKGDIDLLSTLILYHGPPHQYQGCFRLHLHEKMGKGDSCIHQTYIYLTWHEGTCSQFLR